MTQYSGLREATDESESNMLGATAQLRMKLEKGQVIAAVYEHEHKQGKRQLHCRDMPKQSEVRATTPVLLPQISPARNETRLISEVRYCQMARTRA